MAFLKHPGWFDSAVRRKVFDPGKGSYGYTYFGLRPLPVEEKKEAERQHFTRVAPRYDFMDTVLSLGIHYAWKRKAVAAMGLQPGDRVLDVCGGTGDLAVYAAGRIGRQGKVFICDMNEDMMRAGMDREQNRRFCDRIHCIRGDAECMAFPDHSFDAAMVGFGIRNLTRLKQGFAEIYRVLRPGGKMMCLEFSKPANPVFREIYDLYSFYVMPFVGRLMAGSSSSYACLSETIRMFATPEELKTILEETGFRSVSYTLLTNGIAAIHSGQKPEKE